MVWIVHCTHVRSLAHHPYHPHNHDHNQQTSFGWLAFLVFCTAVLNAPVRPLLGAWPLSGILTSTNPYHSPITQLTPPRPQPKTHRAVGERAPERGHDEGDGGCDGAQLPDLLVCGGFGGDEVYGAVGSDFDWLAVPSAS